jgi:hypothetical protein
MSIPDQVFLDSGVKYLPWIGEHYADGFHGRRLLVLGESFFDQFNGEKHQLDSNMTRDCVEETINREEGCAKFWHNVERALVGDKGIHGWPQSGGKPLWNRLAQYNFVQAPVDGGAQQSPTTKQFRDSWSPFRSVLDALRPERVWVCGHRLWFHMEDTSEAEDVWHDFMQIYRLSDGTPVPLLTTYHPSSPPFNQLSKMSLSGQ